MAKATYIGTDSIVNGWKEKAETPFFSLWVKSVKCEQNTVNDWEKAEEKLTNQINDFVREGYGDILILKIHPEKKASYGAKDDAVAMYCQAVRTDTPSIGYLNPNQAILEKLNAIESRINAIEGETVETEEGDEESAEVGQTEAMLQSINGILNHPITNLLVNYLQLPAMTAPPTPPPAALAGTDDQAELEQALTTLFNKGVTVEHIKKLAAMPKQKISMLISML